MRKASFANRLILNFTFVVFVGFLAVYFLFNSLIDNHIRAEAMAELDREIMTVEFRDNNWSNIEIILGTRHSNRAILNVDTIIVDNEGTVLLPNPFNLSEDENIKTQALAVFFNNNQNLFGENNDMIIANHAGHTFYMRATQHYVARTGAFFFEPVPVSVLMYTDITPAMNLKNNMNQILLFLLTTSGTLTLSISIILSTRFKKSIKRISKHAQIIGQGNFDEKIEDFGYSEFNNLANSMNNMAHMLGTYETSQKQFFQNVSHELRTPLMSIQGYTEGIRSGVFINDVATDIILEESKKMTELIDDILYLSKLNKSKESQLNLSNISINAFVASVSGRISIIAKKENKHIIINPSSDFDIKTDKDKLERAIINILSNAIRYAKEEISISCLVVDNLLNITIRNDGPPIDKIDLPRIFDRFYKGSSGNTGLGLAITKEIITNLGGSIYADNFDGGVSFIIKLPVSKNN